MENLNSFESFSSSDSSEYLNNNFALSKKENKSVHIWICEIKKHLNLLQYEHYLNEGELHKASRFKFQEDKNQYIISHVFIRIILSKYLQTKASLLEFKYGKNNKPSLSHNASDYHFNISKTGDLTVLVIGISDEVGIDIERINPEFDYSEIISNYYSQTEQESIKYSDDIIINTQFFYLWTRKEALVKAVGMGLDCDLKEVEVLDKKLIVKSGDNSNLTTPYYLSSFILDSKYILSIARQGFNKKLRFFNGLGQLTKLLVGNIDI